MKSINSAILIQEIEKTIKCIKTFQGLQQNAMAYFAQFLVVYICGIYEEIIESTVVEMVNNLGRQEITSFTKKTLCSSFRNPNMGKIVDLFIKFDNQTWIDQLKNMPQINKTALDSIVENKNSLAHGQPLLNLTISDIEKYYADSKKIIEKIDELLL